jgi:hypothetical protein
MDDARQHGLGQIDVAALERAWTSFRPTCSGRLPADACASRTFMPILSPISVIASGRAG